MLNKKLELLRDGYTVIHNVISEKDINVVRSLYLDKLQEYQESTLLLELFFGWFDVTKYQVSVS